MSRSSTSNSSAPTSDFRRSVRFAGRCLLFLLPLLVWAVPLEIVLLKSGDAWPINLVAARQTPDSNILFGRAFMSQQFNVYKAKMIRHRRPALLIVGSSRVMQFRKEMFPPLESQFYNAGGLLQTLADVEQLAEQWRTTNRHRPRAAIIGIDPWWLSRGQPTHESWLRGERTKDAALHLSGHLAAFQRTTQHVLEGGSLALSHDAQRFNFRPIGVQAARANGFRPDGSRLYGHHLIDAIANPGYRDRESPPIIDRVRQGLRRFEASDGLDPARVARLSTALTKMQSANVEVSLVLIPVSTEVDAALRASAQLKRWWHEYRTVVPQIASECGASVVIAPTPRHYGLNDEAMFDGNHPGELLASHLAEELVTTAPVGWLLSEVDTHTLQATRDPLNPLGTKPSARPRAN